MAEVNHPTESELLRWRRLKPLLRLVAESAYGSIHDRTLAHERLHRAVDQLRGTGPVDDVDWASELTDAVVAIAENIATPLDHADPPAEAILAWREYLKSGGSIRALGPRLSTSQERVVQGWSAPQRTVRERMWLSDDEPPSKQLTATAWPGIRKILIACEDALGVTLPSTLPAVGAPSEQVGYPLPGDRSDFICDVTVPDGTEFDQGDEFVKTWRIWNSGSVPWVGRYLTRQGGEPGPGSHTSPGRIVIPDTSPGQSVDLSVPMRAALLPGTSASTWKMTDEEGRLFFPDRYRYGLYCEIITRGNH